MGLPQRFATLEEAEAAIVAQKTKKTTKPKGVNRYSRYFVTEDQRAKPPFAVVCTEFTSSVVYVVEYLNNANFLVLKKGGDVSWTEHSKYPVTDGAEEEAYLASTKERKHLADQYDNGPGKHPTYVFRVVRREEESKITREVICNAF